jgi:transposase
LNWSIRIVRCVRGRTVRSPGAPPLLYSGAVQANRRREGRPRGEPGRQVPAAHQRPKLPAEDIALGYKQLLEVERSWRDMKQVIDLRPACHREEERIRAHIILCWLALLLARITETTRLPGFQVSGC